MYKKLPPSALLIVSCLMISLYVLYTSRTQSSLFAQVMTALQRSYSQYYRPVYSERYFPAPNMYLRRIRPAYEGSLNPVLHTSLKPRKIALTFDACSTLLPSHADSAVIQILIRTGTPATLFLGGKWVQDRPEDARFLARIPFFEIGNHSYLHGHLTRVSDERLRDEIRWTQEIIYTITGIVPRFFRPPYIEYDDRVIRTASSFGLTTVIGDIPSGDPDPHATKEKLIEEILHGIKNGTIVIMHMNKGGKHTAEALPETIRLLREKGYTLVTMSELLEDQNQVLGGNTIGGSLGKVK